LALAYGWSFDHDLKFLSALRALSSAAVRLEAGTRCDSQPVALGGGAVGGFVAIDQAEARLRFVGWDVESDPAAVGQLGVETPTHQLAGEGIAFAFDQQLGDAALQGLGFVLAGFFAVGGRGGQFRNVVEDAFGQGDAHYAGRFFVHSSAGISMPSLHGSWQ
jgi:hypothetical protein